MPVIFQRTIDKTLHDINSKFVYVDDILIIAKGTLEDHKKIDRILHRLNEENLAISLQKCKFAREEITWLGLTITPNGVTPTNQKCEALIHHLIKFIPSLAEISELLRPLLSKANTKSQNRLDWKDQHTIALNQIKEQIKKITKNKHFDTTKQTRVRCDASKKSLGACLEQKCGNTWETIAFASRFLNNLESRYSTIELELLAVVWSLEHFKFYLYGSEFILQTYYQAMLTALKEDRGNKTYQSRLTRWADRLLPFQFTVEHVPGKNKHGLCRLLKQKPIWRSKSPLRRRRKLRNNCHRRKKLIFLRIALSPNGVKQTTNRSADTN